MTGFATLTRPRAATLSPARVLVALAFVIGALPLLVACPVPLQDWENHVAGSHVLAALLDGDPFWARFYRFNTFLVPNAAVDLGLLGLRWLGCDPALAANLFLLATYFLFVAGFAALSRALVAESPAKIPLAVLLFYSSVLFWGLVNYVLGIGLALGLLAVWLMARGPLLRLAIAGVGAACLLSVHVVPAVVFACALACFDAAAWWRARKPLASLGSAPLACTIILGLLKALPGDTGHDWQAVYTGAGSIGAMLAWKLWVVESILLGGTVLQDAVSVAAALGVVLVLALTARLRLAFAAAGAVFGLALLMLAAPERLGTGSLLDLRLAWPPLLIAVAGVRLAWRSRPARRLALAAITVVVVGRTALIAGAWHEAAEVFAEYDAQAAGLPRGGIMMMAHGRALEDISWSETWSPPLHSIAPQVVPRGLFYPALFANPAQQPIALRPRYAQLGQPWDLSDATHAAAAVAALQAICAHHEFSGVYLTMLYVGPFARAFVAPATLYEAASFLLVDACRLTVPS